MSTHTLFERYYHSKAGYVGGTERFHEICCSQLPRGGRILEIGAGPANPTTAYLASLGSVTGLDVSREALANPSLSEAHVFDGSNMPLPDEAFDLCVSNYVLEHVADPASHFQEVFRVLKPGAAYCFRTPNRWHYVTIASSVLPHSVHLHLANKLRGLDAEAHDPWPTVYRANTRGALRRLAQRSGLEPVALRMIEAEPSYGAAHPLLFFPMMMYERLVNSSELLSNFRVNILGTFRKPGPSAGKNENSRGVVRALTKFPGSA